MPAQAAMGEAFLFLVLIRRVVPFSTCCADVVLGSAQKHCAQAFKSRQRYPAFPRPDVSFMENVGENHRGYGPLDTQFNASRS